MSRTIFLQVVLVTFLSHTGLTFSVYPRRRPQARAFGPSSLHRATTTTAKEDPFRTDARPSLHPLTINALAEVLRKRSIAHPKFSTKVPPIELAISTSQVAASLIGKRQEASAEDGMELSQEEMQTVAGRVVGVVMRLPDLESQLVDCCDKASWIAKYEEWNRFGLTGVNGDDAKAIAEDPLLRMNKSECLLAIYLHHVEVPELAAKNITVPDNSIIDFLEDDRKDVLLQDN